MIQALKQMILTALAKRLKNAISDRLERQRSHGIAPRPEQPWRNLAGQWAVVAGC
jgi:hypothetical protein